MKGLSLTLSVVVIAIALVITVLVVVTVFNKQITQFIGVINPWSQEKVLESLCRDRCATYCGANIGESGTDWKNLQVTYQGVSKKCDEVMKGIFGEAADIGTCKC